MCVSRVHDTTAAAAPAPSNLDGNSVDAHDNGGHSAHGSDGRSVYGSGEDSTHENGGNNLNANDENTPPNASNETDKWTPEGVESSSSSSTSSSSSFPSSSPNSYFEFAVCKGRDCDDDKRRCCEPGVNSSCLVM